MFPCGEFGWAPKKLPLANTTADYVTLLQYYAYMLFARDDFNPCVCMSSLSQQFIVDAFTKVDDRRLNYYYFHQAHLRTELYQGLMDYVHDNNNNDHTRIGKKVILPSSSTGCQRSIYEKFMDSTCLLQHYDEPDFLLR